MRFKYIETASAISRIAHSGARADYAHLSIVDPKTVPKKRRHRSGPVVWVGGYYLVKIPVQNILFEDGNIWNAGHVIALAREIKRGNNFLDVPAARVYQIDADEVKISQKYEREGELDYQMGMTEPWKKKEIGQYNAQLLDGHHRSAAAILAGARSIYIYVGENYRDNVRPQDYVR